MAPRQYLRTNANDRLPRVSRGRVEGLEAAAALRTRGLEVDVIASDAIPLGRIMGPEIGSLHEAHGVRFHLGQTAAGFDGRTLSLANGERPGI
jgi:NADPH-dependent 2,4-dienoyl-CoA reductase/sulfur reductase-like enzyme